MTDRDLSRKPRRSPYVVVITILAVFQIVLGALTVCTPVVYFSGIPEMLLAWQEDFQSKMPKGPGQPQISQLEIQRKVHDRLPWLRAFERLDNGISLGLSGMMVAGGVGLLYRRSWARPVTLAWAVLSLGYTASSTCGDVAQAITQMEVTAQVFEDMPPPPPGQPDLRPMMKSMMQSMGPMVYIGPVFGAMLAFAYAITILVLMMLPSLVAALRADAAPESAAEQASGRTDWAHDD